MAGTATGVATIGIDGNWPKRSTKGTDFSELTDEMLAEIEWKLNHRPRKSLGYRTPLEYCKELFNFDFRSALHF